MTMTYRELQQACREIRELTGDPVKLNSKIEILQAYYNDHHSDEKEETDFDVSEFLENCSVIYIMDDSEQDDSDCVLEDEEIEAIYQGEMIPYLDDSATVYKSLESKSNPDIPLPMLLVMACICLASVVLTTTIKTYYALGKLALWCGYATRRWLDTTAIPLGNRGLLALSLKM